MSPRIVNFALMVLTLYIFQWSRYMRCDGSPDPTVPGEINTYINLRLEDKENNDIDIVLKQGQQDLAVSRTIYELQHVISNNVAL